MLSPAATMTADRTRRECSRRGDDSEDSGGKGDDGDDDGGGGDGIGSDTVIPPPTHSSQVAGNIASFRGSLGGVLPEAAAAGMQLPSPLKLEFARPQALPPERLTVTGKTQDMPGKRTRTANGSELPTAGGGGDGSRQRGQHTMRDSIKHLYNVCRGVARKNRLVLRVRDTTIYSADV